MRPALIAFCSVRVVPSWPTTSSNRCGRHLRANAWYVLFGSVVI
jgi:hypothetical protein